ncbi:hypothetical protein P3T35_003594 [Kitasatospora sp. GP30]|uniref:hypothetical protein n=1 Tax=Kitasatospora sp. GP30 TaxID=3035084 RepID=UPI000CB57036|nr:hypothetical protein [Kitasatospora sp. GP30]MDH6141575.1 hypothetical protein [Kitasatospora sp. GP30]
MTGKPIRGRGINYDTGFAPMGDLSRPRFDPAEVAEELRVIAEELHCTAVRISGGLPERIELAAESAAAHGLEVWFAPFPCNMTLDQLVPFFLDCARRAERIRRSGAEVVLVLGCELSLFAEGFIPGDSFAGRMAALAAPDRTPLVGTGDRVNAFFAGLLPKVRAEFGGRISYASGVWEKPDWSGFDLVGVDAYRDAGNADHFRQLLAGAFEHGKPVAVTEFGCCAYQGAGARGGMGWAVVDHETEPARITEPLVRDEQEQVRYLRELLADFEEAGVDSAFWFTFAHFEAPHRPEDPAHDLDLASYGVVAMLPEGGRQPKAVFAALAEAYQR